MEIAMNNYWSRVGLFLMGCILSVAAAQAAPFTVQPVAPGIYAFVGELGLRTYENEGMNATAGFIVTPEGVVVVDSGSSWRVAQQMHAAIRKVTAAPVKYVINTGGQDHRWLGNGYFKAQGAQIIAQVRTIADIEERGAMQVAGLQQELRDRFAGTGIVMPDISFEQEHSLMLGGKDIRLLYFGGGHTPGDSVVWLPQDQVLFAGDLVFVDRLLGVLPFSRISDWLASLAAIERLAPTIIVPGHGVPCDLAKAQRETTAYLRLLNNHMRQALDSMVDLQEAIDSLDQSAYAHLPNYEMLKGGNASRVYLELEIQ
jgi:glyoxylase-like metal-dependent hydrolase (beta-lactamase superfamily II)